MFQPLNDLAVELLLNSNVGHARCGRSAVPMLFAGREPDDITGPDLLDRATFALSPAKARRNDQSLPERMSVSCCSCAWLECYAGGLDKSRIRRLKQRIDAHIASEPLGGAYCGGLRAHSFDFHVCTPSTSLRTEQGFDGPTLVHGTVSFCHLMER